MIISTFYFFNSSCLIFLFIIVFRWVEFSILCSYLNPIFARGVNVIGEGFWFHVALSYCLIKKKFWEMLSFTCKKRGHFVPLSPEEWFFSLCCGFPHWPQTLCSLSQGRIPTNVQDICTVTEEQNIPNMHHICP